MTQIEQNVLKALENRKKEPQQTNLNTVWQECGRIAAGEFLYAWRNLTDRGHVTGNATDQHGTIVGLGRITDAGEQALKEPISTQELIDVLPEGVKNRARKALSEFFRNLHEGLPCTLIVTTDGKKFHVIDSGYPLPDRYLEKWDEDKRRFDADLNLD